MPADSELWVRLEERLLEYSTLPSADVPIDGGVAEPDAPEKARATSRRIQRPLNTHNNQHRQPKMVTATLDWRAVDAPGAADAALEGPAPRVGMSLTRLGWGQDARLVLFGGFGPDGFVPSELELFNPTSMRWVEPEKAVRGRRPWSRVRSREQLERQPPAA